MEQQPPREISHKPNPVLPVETILKIYRNALKGDYLECNIRGIIVRGFSLSLPSELDALRCKIPMLSIFNTGTLIGRHLYDTQKTALFLIDDNLMADSIITSLNTKFSQRKRPSDRFQIQAIGLANTIRPFALDGWIGRDPHFFFRGIIPMIVFIHRNENGGRSFPTENPALDLDDDARVWEHYDEAYPLRNAEFKTTCKLTAKFGYYKTLVLNVKTDSTVGELKELVATAAGSDAVEIGFLDQYRYHDKVVVQYGWNHDKLKLSRCVCNGRLPKHPSPLTEYPFLYAVSVGENPFAGMDEDPDVDASLLALEASEDIFTLKRHDAAVRKNAMQYADDIAAADAVTSAFISAASLEKETLRDDPASPSDAVVDSAASDTFGEDDAAEEFIVESIIGHRYNRWHNLEFLVKWLGYDNTFDSWEPYTGVNECTALDLYSRENPKLQLPRPTSSRRQRLN